MVYGGGFVIWVEEKVGTGWVDSDGDIDAVEHSEVGKWKLPAAFIGAFIGELSRW